MNPVKELSPRQSAWLSVVLMIIMFGMTLFVFRIIDQAKDSIDRITCIVVYGIFLTIFLIVFALCAARLLLNSNIEIIMKLVNGGFSAKGIDGMARPFSHIQSLLQRGKAEEALRELDELRAAHPALESAAQALACRILHDDLRRPQEALPRALTHLRSRQRPGDDDAATLHLAVDLLMENQQRERALALLDDMIPRFPEGALRRELQRRRSFL